MARFDLTGIGMTSQRTRDRLVGRLRERGIVNEDVLHAIASTPRHIFIDEALAHRAYEDTALPIGHGQTISQPFVVALMTQVLLDRPRARVLELGTGSGYQTAILASLCERVFTIERVEPLISRAEARLRAMSIKNVTMRHADGFDGWPRTTAFDGIMVTAAPRTVPETLLEQLAVGGRMVLPVGDGGVQELRVIDRGEEGFSERVVDHVRFVPLLKGVRTH
ncbi:MAG: protein-L-isoaspartate(D-aspartate) O-methyltransferase [Proteobacteria bacterium]|nr:protein-L-isoaspartate(D-aspartate) O-methyltransferase [Pseudomonadota bacterium]